MVSTKAMTKESKAAYDRLYRANNADQIAAFKAIWYQENKSRVSVRGKEAYKQITRDERDRRNAAGREWRKNNKEKASAIAARSYEKNIEKKKAYGKKHREMYPWKKAAACMKRIAAKKSATPPWADTEAIEQIYRKSAEMTATTGTPHQVDHIWPLQGEGFSGLHVHWNLQVLPRRENVIKSNKRPDAYC